MDSAKFVIFLAIVLGGVSSEDVSMEDPAMGTRIKTMGQSGKILMAPNDEFPISSSPDAVTITMDAIQEIDTNGDVITAGSEPHSFNTFASQEFTFSALETGTLHGISTEFFEFSATIGDMAAQLKVTVYLIKEDGSITLDGETTEVEAGSMKWAIELTGWSWCSPCSQGPNDYTGAFVDFVVEIKGKGAPQPSDDGGDTANYSVGNAKLKLSKKVKVGSTWTDMPAGYPSLTTVGSKTLFTFRFARDGDSAFFYDPTLSFSGTGTNRAAVSLVSILALLVAIVLNY